MRATQPIGQQYAAHARRFGAEPDGVRLERAFRSAMASAPPMAFPARGPADIAELERRWWEDVVGRVVVLAGLSDVLRGSRFDEFFSALYAHFTTAAAWELYPDVLPSLERLRAGGTRLGLITNYDTRVFAVLQNLGLAEILSIVVIPAQVGSAKPDRAIFDAALERASASPEEALHVGDEVEDDYEGARAAGMKAVLLDRSGRFLGRPGIDRIGSLDDLRPD